MLTVYALTDAKQAATYYENDNYYHKGSVESVAATHWWGKGADFMGLSGYVESERFAELLKGRIDSETILRRIRHDDGVDHKPGYDLTFSAPKSVSMLAEIGQDYRIHEAHDRAVNAALTYLESRVAEYRQTTDGKTELKKGNNLTVAKFRHDTSRAVDDTVDCQLHTHCVVLNAVMGDDGKWRSLNERSMYDFKMVGGMIYRSYLAKELKSLGYSIRKTREDGLFEVAGFTRQDIEAFSKRRVKILEVMQEQGLFGSQAAQAVTLSTRETKLPIDRQKLNEQWRIRANEQGLNLNDNVTHAKQLAQAGLHIANNPKLLAERAVEYAIAHLGERQSVFQEQDIIKTALQYALGDVQIDDVHHALGVLKGEYKVVSLGTHKHRELYTSPKIIAQENELVEMMKKGKGECDPIASRDTVNAYLTTLAESRANGYALTACQRKAVAFLATNNDRMLAIQGYAGTGKTTSLDAVCRLVERAGYSVRGAAPSSSAADVLRTDTGIKTDTLSALLLDLATEKPPRWQLSTKPELIIVDESSMASTGQMHDLFTQAERLNKRLILVGDRYQLPAVENGDPVGLLHDAGIALSTLTQVVRQEAKDLAFAVRETIRGDVDYAFQAIGNAAFIERNADGQAMNSPQSSIREIADKPQRLAAIAHAYLTLESDERDNTIVLLGSNDDRKIVNTFIRDGLNQQRNNSHAEINCLILKGKGFTAIEKTHLYNYTVGDIVRFNKAYRSMEIKRFDYATVVEIDVANESLILEKQGKRFSYKPETSAKTKGGALEIFEQEERVLAAGDKIRWTQNRKNYAIHNTDTANVLSVSGNTATIECKNGKTITLDLTKSINNHWDYAWSATVYASQGKKAKNVIAQVEGDNKHLTHYRAFYVTISRAVNSLRLFVDNLDKAITTVKTHTGKNSNATTFMQAHQQKQAVEKYIKTAYLKLDGHIHEVENELSRLEKLATQYVTFPDRNSVYLIVTDYKDRKRTNALIREALKTKGELHGQAYSEQTLRAFHIRSVDDKMKLSEGLMVGFDRGHQKKGIIKGEYYRVARVDEIGGHVVLEHTTGKQVDLSVDFLVKRQGNDVGIYKVDNKTLLAGDEIFWTKSYRGEGVVKDQAARVQSITDNAVTLVLHNQKTVTFKRDAAPLWHWDHHYARNISATAPKQYDYALSHLDARTVSPARVSAIFGAMGRAKKGAHIFTHSRDYVVNQLQKVSEQDIKLHRFPNSTLDNKQAVNQALQAFDEKRRTVGKAWASYFKAKKIGQGVDDSLRNALVLDRAQAELASSITTDPEYNSDNVAALGIDTQKLDKYTKQHSDNTLIKHYHEASSDLIRGYYAKQIMGAGTIKKNQLAKENIDSKKLTALSYDFSKRVTQLTLTPAERRDQKIVDAYFHYSQQARGLWKRLYRSKDQGQKPDRSHFTFANHVSILRNELAYEMTTHPERFSRLLQYLKPKTNNTLRTHAQKFKQNLEREVQRERVVKTQDWHTLLDADLHEQGKSQGIEAQYTTRHKKVYWDKNLVLKALMPNAEEIISTLIDEERNAKKSNARIVVWGKKNGSVQLHLSGSKEGVINDYERGIHGDLITYYAKRRGIDWYDSLCELAAEARLDPDSAGIKPVIISPEEKAKKQRAIIAEQKERAAKRKVAGKIWDGSVPIKGTVVERYLKDKRGMPFDVNRLEVRYHDNAPDKMYFKNGKMQIKTRKPAMIVAFRDCNDTLTAVQCTYLDKKTNDKDQSANIAKRTVGQVWGSAGCIYKGGDAKIIVAEGCETGANLVVAAPDASIYITGGNMQNVGHYAYLATDENKKAIHIAADNDLSTGSGSWKATEAGAKQLATDGIKPLVAQPEVVNGEKTDFNDVLLQGGSEKVKAQFYPQYSVDPKDNSVSEITLAPVKPKKVAMDQNLFSSYEAVHNNTKDLSKIRKVDKDLKNNDVREL